jgi:hypothetical protein
MLGGNPPRGIRVARELTTLIGTRGKTQMIASDNGTEFNSNVIPNWAKDHAADWHLHCAPPTVTERLYRILQRLDVRRAPQRETVTSISTNPVSSSAPGSSTTPLRGRFPCSSIERRQPRIATLWRIVVPFLTGINPPANSGRNGVKVFYTRCYSARPRVACTVFGWRRIKYASGCIMTRLLAWRPRPPG